VPNSPTRAERLAVRAEEQKQVDKWRLIIVYIQGKGYGLMHSGQQFRIEQDGPEEQVWEAVVNTIKHEAMKGYMDFDVSVHLPEDYLERYEKRLREREALGE
jgi:hypothetical protein